VGTGGLPAENSFMRILSVVVALSYVATLTACSTPSQSPAPWVGAPARAAKSVAVGALEISRSGSGLLVRLINPKDGAASSSQGYSKDKGTCKNGKAPCYLFSATDGTAPVPVRAQDCTVVATDGYQTAYCKADGVSAITIEAPDGGTIGHDASSESELGKDCFPSSVIYEAGDKDVYSVLAWDGCKERVHCLGKNVGTVDADSKDVIQGPCYFVQRH
jgi:hypothetical protein